MSNVSVGNIYHQIINEVIEASRVDFEDQGVGEEVLEELRKVCSLPPLLCLPCTSCTPPERRCRLHPASDACASRALLDSIPPHALPFPASKSVSRLECTGLASSLAGLLQGALAGRLLGCLGRMGRFVRCSRR